MVQALLLAVAVAQGGTPVADPFAPPEALLTFARSVAPIRLDEKGRLDALVEAVFRSQKDGGLGVQYDNDYTRTVEEVWRDRRANCLSLTALCIAACKAVGIHADFAEVVGSTAWSRNGELVLQERHIVALVRAAQLRDDLVLDFNPRVRSRLGMYALVTLTPERARALFHSNRAAELLTQRRLDEALIQSQRAVTEDPDLSVGWNAEGLVLKALGRVGEAEDAYRRGLTCDREDASILNNLEVLLRENGRFKEADHVRSESRKLRERNPYYQSFLAEEALGTGDLDEAMRRIKRAIHRYKREPRFYLLKARILMAQGREKKATQVLERGAELASDGERERYDIKLTQMRQALAASQNPQ